MFTLEQLKQKHLTDLAVLCGELAARSANDPVTIAKAHALRLEWVGSQRPPQRIPTDLHDQHKLTIQQQSLRERMCEFLSDKL